LLHLLVLDCPNGLLVGDLMARHTRKMFVSGDHLNPDTGPPWSVLWDTTARSDGHWSIARTPSETSALERAAHFLELGFVVHAIKDPAGSIVMDRQSLASRFAADHERPSSVPPRRSLPSAESSAVNILHGRRPGLRRLL